MRTMVWTCDRCRVTVEVPELPPVIVADYSPEAAVRSGFKPAAWSHLPDWQEHADDESIADVCPSCLTAGERADALLAEVEADAMFRENTA